MAVCRFLDTVSIVLQAAALLFYAIALGLPKWRYASVVVVASYCYVPGSCDWVEFENSRKAPLMRRSTGTATTNAISGPSNQKNKKALFAFLLLSFFFC